MAEPVEAPQKKPPRFSLRTSADVLTLDDGHWGQGFTYEPESCGEGRIGTYDLTCAAAPDDETKDIGDGETNPTWQPFAIWAGDKCKSVGGLERDWQGRATRRLVACESKLVAREMWTGERAQAATEPWPSRWLASDDANVVTSAPIGAMLALGRIEQALATCDCGGTGMIHVPPVFMSMITDSAYLHLEGNNWVTMLGNIVVPDAGYPGTDPEGQDLTEEGVLWIYGTSKVTLRFGKIRTVPDRLSEALNKANNMIEYRAERIAAYSFDCCHFGAAVDAQDVWPDIGEEAS